MYNTASNNVKPRFSRRFQSWGLTDEEVETNTWSYTSCLPTPKPEIHRDHICRPVIIGSDGKAIPAVFQYRNAGGNGRCIQNEQMHEKNPARVTQEFHRSSAPSEASESGRRRSGFPGGIFRNGRFAAEGLPSEEKRKEAAEATVGWAWRGRSNGGGAGYGMVQPERQLGRVTNDVGAAAAQLKESALSVIPARKKEEVIDSRAAVKKYGGSFFI